jgi:tetratricopeptide (TPR) repeat protein
MGAAGGQNQQGMMASVAQTIEKAKSNPKDFQAQLEAAQVQAQIGRTKEAVEFLLVAYDADPAATGKTGAFPFMGQYYFEDKNYDEAEKWFRRAVEADPADADVFVELGAIQLQRQPPSPDKAIKEIEQALKINPKSGHALGHLIDAYLMKKDAAQAEASLAKLKEAEPKNQRIASYDEQVANLKAGKPVTIPKE